MEEKKVKTQPQNLEAEVAEPDSGGWVSPEVLAAQRGESVEMGKELPSNEELDRINNA